MHVIDSQRLGPFLFSIFRNKVQRTEIVCMMLLGLSNERNKSRTLRLMQELFPHDLNDFAVAFAIASGIGDGLKPLLFPSTRDFVIAWWRAWIRIFTAGQWAKYHKGIG